MNAMPWWIAALLLWHALASIVAFGAFGVDKSLARRGARRIRERTLHLISLLGGWPGALAGRALFRHKTIDRRFSVRLGAVVLLHVSIWAGAAYLALAGCASAPASRDLLERRVSQTIPQEVAGPVRISITRGVIDVAPDLTLQGAHVEATLRAPSRTLLERSALRVERTSDGAIEIEPMWDEEAPRGARLEAVVTVRLPRVGAVTAEAPGGRIRVRDAGGPVEASTEFGEILVTLRGDNPGPVRLRTENGDVRLGVGRGFRGELEARAEPERIILTNDVRRLASQISFRSALDEARHRLLFGPIDRVGDRPVSFAESVNGFVIIGACETPPEAPAASRPIDRDRFEDERRPED